MSHQLPFVACAGLLGTISFGAVAQAEKPPHLQWLDQFESDWNEAAWTQKSRGNAGYMRPLEDQGWKTRMRVLQALIAEGRSAVPVLLERLNSKSAPQRILAAQALGYLAPFVPRKALLRVAKDDDNPSVRLYAVDALGMHGGNSTIDWQRLRKSEPNRDIQKHIGYAIARGDAPVDPSVVDNLAKWNAEQIDSARTGHLAPDFELHSAAGGTVKLSQYRMRKAVVLVFIYGDT